jgi:phage gpG-like protein
MLRVIPAAGGLADLRRRLPAILEKAMARALETGLEAARARMRPGGGGPRVRSGRLLRSLGSRVTRRGEAVVGELYAEAPYAAAQEHGAVIQARRRKHLRFMVEGRWVMARRVVLPARPFLRPGRDAAAQALEKELVRALEEELS